MLLLESRPEKASSIQEVETSLPSQYLLSTL